MIEAESMKLLAAAIANRKQNSLGTTPPYYAALRIASTSVISSSLSRQAIVPATLLSICSTLVAPAITEEVTGFVASQLRASSKIVCP